MSISETAELMTSESEIESSTIIETTDLPEAPVVENGFRVLGLSAPLMKAIERSEFEVDPKL